MATKSLRCFVEINIRAVTSPGTWLPKRDDVFLSVSLFGQVRQTRMAGSVFPLIFHDKLKFDKVFYSAYEPSQIADKLLEETVRIELLQISNVFVEGRLLAWYESNAKLFLYPSPYFTLTYGLNGREIILERSLNFPGISPRMEFSTKTVIHETSSMPSPVNYLTTRNSSSYNDADGYNWSNNVLKRSQTSSTIPAKSYGRSTLSSTLKNKTRFDGVNDDIDYIDDDPYINPSKSIEDRPPFVVRKVDDDLVGRKPSPLYPRIRPRSMERRSDVKLMRSRSLSPEKNKHFDQSYIDHDSGNEEMMDGYEERPSLSRHYAHHHHDYSSHMDVIRARIDRALRRNRSMERLELLDKLKSYYRWPLCYDYLDDLELEVELARRRRRLLFY